MHPLDSRLVEDAVVYPTIRVASHPGRLLMGVFDADGYVEDTVLDRRSGEVGAPMVRGLFPDVVEGDDPEAIYAGPLYFHFGHFLLESLARAWYARQRPDLPLVWAGAHTWHDARLRPWQVEILEVLGLTNPPRILASPTRYRRLHVPDLGYRYDDRFHPEHAAFLASYRGPAQVPGERLWLSRSNLASDVRDLNAAPTERRLAAAGWTVSHPEKLTVREQLDQLSRAEVVAGEEGSAFHTIALLADVSTKRLRVLRRHGQEHNNMHTVGDARGVDQSFHSLRDEVVLEAKGRAVTKVSARSAEVLDLLDVAVPPAPEADDAPSETALLLRVLEGLAPSRLLDLGATDAALALGSTAEKRVAVSPSFGFDTRSYAGSGVDFLDLDARTYVKHFVTQRRRFDVIRVTGPDLPSVLAAFRASRRLATPTTTWLLGTGDLAARAAVAVGLTHPGYAVRRMVVRRTVVFVVHRVADEPTSDAGIADLPDDEIARRTRRIPLALPRFARSRSRAGRSR
ncbi:glycosyltransferase 61 family protein [Nocardioides sp. 1609]|uniref:glycosyltransferase 61 family protein n=1 Tax=Nocardioides sp. 1609 TaxID=2508327 RepID=UPI0010704C0E|nr:glycosyltransferase 61 family protein [Nocardioides sp. 1609]